MFLGRKWEEKKGFPTANHGESKTDYSVGLGIGRISTSSWFKTREEGFTTPAGDSSSSPIAAKRAQALQVVQKRARNIDLRFIVYLLKNWLVRY
jgi:hypothetical protein